MLECVVMGDSIAVGTAATKELHSCYSYAKGGINTWQWNQIYPSITKSSDKVIISLGTNDHRGVNTRKELEKVRQKVEANKVYWILPYGNLEASKVSIAEIQNIVKDIAAQYKDTVIAIEDIQVDKIHPSWSGYKKIVDQVKKN